MGGPEAQRAPEILIAPCARGDRLGCRLVRRAVELVAARTPEVGVCEPADGARERGRFVVAVDGSSVCQASAALRDAGVRPGAVVSAPAAVARLGLMRPGVDVEERFEELAAALAGAIEAALGEALAQARERRRYREEMGPVLERFQGMWARVEALPPPDGRAPTPDRARVELLGKRARNLFVRFDDIAPPAEWAEPHDLFQDALLCIAYACEGWAAGNAPRWEQHLEKARAQLQPLLRRLQPSQRGA